MPSPTTPLIDTFTRANEDPLAGGLWLGPIFSGDAQLRIVSNVVKGRSTGGAEAYHKTAGPANQEIWLTLATKWANLDLGIALFTNLQAPNAAGVSGYVVAVFSSSGLGVDAADCYRIDSGAFTHLGVTASPLTIAAGHKFWLQNVGGVITLYQHAGSVWTSVLARTDTTYGAGFFGVALDDDTPLIDDVGGGAVGSASRMLAVF